MIQVNIYQIRRVVSDKRSSSGEEGKKVRFLLTVSSVAFLQGRFSLSPSPPSPVNIPFFTRRGLLLGHLGGRSLLLHLFLSSYLKRLFASGW